MSMLINLDDIKAQLASTEKMVKKAEDKIKDLKEQMTKKNNPTLLKEENEDLKLTHQLSQEDIKIYKEKIFKLKEEYKKNKETLSQLREENTKLKEEQNIKKKESKELTNTIMNFKDLYQSINIKRLKETQKENINQNINQNVNINQNTIKEEDNKNKEKFEKIIKKKNEYEKILDELKEKGNQINSDINKQNDIVNGYRNYLNEIQGYLTKFRERLNISVNNMAVNNNNDSKLNEFSSLFENVSIMLFELDDIILENKDNIGQNIENILANIQTNINNLKPSENQNEFYFIEKCNEIEQIIDVIKVIFNDFENGKNRFYSKNKTVEEKINNLKNIQKEFIDQNKKQASNQNNNNNNNQNQNNNNLNINNERRKKLIEQSFLYNVKNASQKLDLYKTINLFQNNDEDDKNIENSELLRKNYHEICYIYDDFEIYDIYYTLKAVGLPRNSSFSQTGFSFYGGYKLEIQDFSLDDEPSEYKKVCDSYISFPIKLYNLESTKVHIKFKATKDLSKLTKGDLEQRKIYRYGYYGLGRELSGEKAKYSLILKGSFDIVNFEDEYFLIRNINNKEEVEYMWGGVVPEEGKRAYIMFSKKDAKFSFTQVLKFNSNNNIRSTRIYLPIEFVGGNNEIININPSSPQASDITLDEENRQYIFEYNNTNYSNIELIIKGELKNKCKGEWNVDLTDEEVEKLMPEEDVKCKDELKIIAKRIIEEFDRDHENSDFEYLDYMKIGQWVEKHIKYNLKYTGKRYSAMEIYNMREGVCYHFTRLCNALLYSLGYKVIYVTGYCCKKSKEFDLDNLHAFSLIRLDNYKWYPFDSTWGIFTGKLHVGHIFRRFDNKSYHWVTCDNIHDFSEKVSGKLIE